MAYKLFHRHLFPGIFLIDLGLVIILHYFYASSYLPVNLADNTLLHFEHWKCKGW